MTDDEIVKALDCCDNCFCDECAYKSKLFHCKEDLCHDALDLINRQKAEIERLRNYAGKRLYIYDNYDEDGELYITDYRLEDYEIFDEDGEELCLYIGSATTREEAWKLLRPYTSFPCEYCPHNIEDDEHCYHCENDPLGWEFEWVRKAIEENWVV